MTDNQIPEAKSFLVGGPPGMLLALAERLHQEPEIRLERVGGPLAAPEFLVISATDEQAERLRLEIAPDGFVEFNAPLNLF
jgi:hypothetical protein